MNIFIIAGEPSGDALGADLIRALQAQSKETVTFCGIGGSLMAAAGMEILLPMAELSVMGLFEILPQLPRLFKHIKNIENEIIQRRPAALITIDFPDFNFILGQRLHKKRIVNCPHIHYVAPTVWAWRKGRAKAVKKFLDSMICLLPFEPPYFEKHHLKSLFVGHPIADTHPAGGSDFRTHHEIPQDAPVLGLLMGSRHGEVARHGRTLVETAIFLHETLTDLHIVCPTLPAREFDVLQLLANINIPTVVTTDLVEKTGAFSAMNAAVAVSGTVGLELAMMHVPHVITYKLSLASYMIMQLCVKTKYAHLVNIVLDKPLIPEYLQKNCDAEKIAAGVLSLFFENEEQKKGFAQARTQLSCPKKGLTSSAYAAKFILARIKSTQSTIKL